MTKNIEPLINTGIHLLNPDDERAHQPRKTIIVSGVARSGTSLVAGVLSKLGVFLGDTACPPVYEDTELGRAMENRELAAAKAIIGRYDEKHAIWGWKRPSSIGYLDEVDAVFSNPIYVFIFKDIFSIAKRNEISMHADLIKNMRSVYKQQGKIIDFIEERNPVAMLVAYDKALVEKDRFVRALCELAGIEASADQFNAAVEFITPNPPDYLDASRITKARGSVGMIKENCVVGWARAVYNDTPIHVELYVNERLVAVTMANLLRENLVEKGLHPTGHAGFRFDLDEDTKLQKGDVIRVRAENEVNDLGNCPLVFGE